MIDIDPQQEIFIIYENTLKQMGYDVYDGSLPPENTPYPFIYLGDFSQSDVMHKNAVTGFVYPTIHVWHNNIDQRGTVSKILFDIKKVIYQTEETTNYEWIIQSLDDRIISDTTTTTPLLHGVVEATLKFS
ncbi:MAG: hypothetical protein ACLVKR_01335 [Lachnospiraceae bacterium]